MYPARDMNFRKKSEQLESKAKHGDREIAKYSGKGLGCGMGGTSNCFIVSSASHSCYVLMLSN